MTTTNSRREFLQKCAVGLAGLTIVPSSVLGKQVGKTAPSDKLHIAGVGIGGKGAENLRNMNSQNIVALCDVDWSYAKGTFDEYPKAKRFWDYRDMYDKMGKEIDAVVVATADHTHAVIAADAITMGKHVYVQKPLTHSIYESRLLTRLALQYGVATQMGNEGASDEGVRKICDWIWAGEIGEVTKVEAFSDRPVWPQGLSRPKEAMKIPDTLRWDLFVGPAEMRPYHSIYTPWNWRGWWDFGVGALGDMACHILDPVFRALYLEYPIAVQGSSTALFAESAPQAQTVRYSFPERETETGILKLPDVTVDWFDGGFKPKRPEGMPDHLMFGGEDDANGVIFYGTKDILFCDNAGYNPRLMSGRTPVVPKCNREITIGHEMDWVRACKENPETRVKTASDFTIAGPLNETVLLGVLAVRLQGLNKTLQWDGYTMQFTNIGDNETVQFLVEDKFHIEDGNPIFDRILTEPIPANLFAQEIIRHTYRNGFKLVDMPIFYY
ncbi:MAG: Gfo/Idh/MocA family oxidoreductase [Tannerellaceae bacterium]|jgi:predicted dehydrogenase|nr:Gfo/Idh/MocA family oxidoreductase [Tannerellaceae bacterium]